MGIEDLSFGLASHWHRLEITFEHGRSNSVYSHVSCSSFNDE